MALDPGQPPSVEPQQQGAGQAAGSDQDTQGKVQRAFELGWHVAELFHFDKARPEAGAQAPGPGSSPTTPSRTSGHRAAREKPATPAPAEASPPPSEAPAQTTTAAEVAAAVLRDFLPGLGSLGADKRKSILIRQVRQNLLKVWAPTPDAPSAADLEASVVEAGAETDPDKFRALVAKIHEVLLSGLTVADFRLGKSYGLGRALAETTIIPCSIGSGRRLPSTLTKADVGKVFETTLKEQFEGGRVMTLQSWLLDLRDWFSAHAAEAVSTTLGGWALWAIRPTIGGRGPDRGVDWDDPLAREQVERALRRQGDVWRGLLSGEKDGMDMAGAEYYFAAMASVLKRIARLAFGFLGTTLGLLLFVIMLVAAVALYFAAHSNNQTGVLAAVIALLGSVGITTGSAGATVKQAWSKVQEPLWQAEISSAVANAAWHNPARLGSIEGIQLLLSIGGKPSPETETSVRHPGLTQLRNLPVGRIGIVLIVASTTIGLFAANAAQLNTDAAFFLPPLCIVAFLAVIDGWDLLIGFSARQSAPFLALPERIALPTWVLPLGEYLAPVLLLTGVLAGHFFWH